MSTFDSLKQGWSKYRARLEREIRVLVVHDEAAARENLDRLLFRCHLSSRTVDDAAQVQELVSRDHYSLVMIGSHLPEMEDLALVHAMRKDLLEVDVLVVTGALRGRAAVDLLRGCIDAGVADVMQWPLKEMDAACEQVRSAVQRNVDRRMRAHVLGQIRGELDRLGEEERQRITGSLEHRLARLRHWIGGFDRALVGEGADPELRALGENLLVHGLTVESTERDADFRARIEQGGLHLVVLPLEGSGEVEELVRVTRLACPLAELVVVSRHPRPDAVLAALRSGVALYMPWPPAERTLLVKRVLRIRQQALRDRLLDSLLVALFWETDDASQDTGARDEAYRQFCELAGVERRLPVTVEEDKDDTDAEITGEGTVGEMLDHILDEKEQGELVWEEAPGTEAGAGDHDRRVHQRVTENQFVRFRPEGSPSSLLAYLGDISQGGVFIRTAHFRACGTRLQVDVNIEHEGLGYLVRCQGEVAWVAQDNTRVAYGPGFGVRFIKPPAEVNRLLQRVIDNRSD